MRPEIVEEVGEHYATVILKSDTKVQEDHAKKIQSCLKNLQNSIKMLIEVYCKSFRVNFSFVQHERPKTFQVIQFLRNLVTVNSRLEVDLVLF